MTTRTSYRIWLASLCLIITTSLHAQKQNWKVSSFGIHLQYQLPTPAGEDRAFIEAHLFEDNPQTNLPDGPVLRSLQENRDRFTSGVNLSMERQLSDNQFAQLRLNVNYSPESYQTFLMPNDAQARINQEGLGFSIDYRRAWKKGVFTFSAGIGAGGKWYINPSLRFVNRLDSTEAANFIANIQAVGQIQRDNFGLVIFQGSSTGPLRPRIDYNIYLPLGVAVQLHRRIQLELDARITAGAQQIIGSGLYTRPIGGTFQLAYVFLL
ncbi:MAG: hypothetical protein AAF927_27885 [Bacteroidota bacterium]